MSVDKVVQVDNLKNFAKSCKMSFCMNFYSYGNNYAMNVTT